MACILACFCGPLLKISISVFYPEVMSVLDFKVCFLDVAYGWVLFTNPVCESFFFILELKPFLLRNMNEHCLMISDILLLYYELFFSPLIGFADLRLSVYVFLDVVNLFCFSFPSNSSVGWIYS